MAEQELTGDNGCRKGIPVYVASRGEGQFPIRDPPLHQAAVPWRSSQADDLLQCVVGAAHGNHCEQLPVCDTQAIKAG
jgi:hypothetical protein